MNTPPAAQICAHLAQRMRICTDPTTAREIAHEAEAALHALNARIDALHRDRLRARRATPARVERIMDRLDVEQAHHREIARIARQARTFGDA